MRRYCKSRLIAWLLLYFLAAMFCALTAIGAAETSGFSDDQRRQSYKEWFAAAEEFALKAGASGYLAMLIEKQALCVPSGMGMAMQEKSGLRNGAALKNAEVCVAPLSEEEIAEIIKNTRNIFNLAFIEPLDQTIVLRKAPSSNFGKAVNVFRVAYQLCFLNFKSYDWSNEEAYCWSWRQTLDFEHAIWKSIGGAEYEKMLSKDVAEFGDEIRAIKTNGRPAKFEKRMSEYPAKLDTIFGETFSSAEKEERRRTYSIFVVFQVFGDYGYVPKYYYLLELYRSEKQKTE